MQVAEHRLPKAFDYHKTPAPFIQVYQISYALLELMQLTTWLHMASQFVSKVARQ